jgi:hypothetical protein
MTLSSQFSVSSFQEFVLFTNCVGARSVYGQKANHDGGPGAPIHKIFLALAAKDGLGEDAGSARAGMTLNKGKLSQGPIWPYLRLVNYSIVYYTNYCNV